MRRSTRLISAFQSPRVATGGLSQSMVNAVEDAAVREELGVGVVPVAGPGVEDRNVVVHLGDEGFGRRVAAAGLAHGPPGGEETQLAVARCLRVRRNDLDAGPDEVGPIADAFRVAAPYHEHDRRVIWQ